MNDFEYDYAESILQNILDSDDSVFTKTEKLAYLWQMFYFNGNFPTGNAAELLRQQLWNQWEMNYE